MTNNNSPPHHSFQCATLELDLELGLLKNRGGACERLSPINLKLLTYFLSRQGEVIRRAEIFDAVWPNQLLSDDVLTRVVSDIRAQLTKLDASSRFIETLPKRGYRWVEPVRPLIRETPVAELKRLNESLVQARCYSLISFDGLVAKFATAGVYLLLALLLAVVSMWIISRPALNQLNIAVLPAVAEHSRAESLAKKLDEDLLLVLRNNPRIKLVSRSAIASRPQNPFPYFSHEFGAEWVLESRVTDSEMGLRVELSLVDARTGFEVRNLSLEAGSNAELLTRLARKLDFEW